MIYVDSNVWLKWVKILRGLLIELGFVGFLRFYRIFHRTLKSYKIQKNLEHPNSIEKY
jgi:hypothetical protein